MGTKFMVPDRLIEDIRDGYCVAFVGAGFSAPAVPTWKGLLKLLAGKVATRHRGEILRVIERTRTPLEYEMVGQLLRDRLGKRFDQLVSDVMKANFAEAPEQAAAWAAEHSRLTHNAEDALGACAALATGIAFGLRGAPNEVLLPAMIGVAQGYSPRLARTMLCAWDQAVRRVDMDRVFAKWLGWSAHDAIAAAVHLLARFPNDPRSAILAGANTEGDSDSIATLAGALIGARCGLDALPANWVRDVERSDALLALSDDLAAVAARKRRFAAGQ